MKNEIKKLVTEFRYAIIESNKNKLPITLKSFPSGSCGDASLLLGRYLKENNVFPIYYISGEKMIHFKNGFKRQTHAWLEYKDIIIDITANQFDEIADCVIVSSNKKWHSQFKIKDKYIVNYKNYDSKTINKLNKAYENIILHLLQAAYFIRFYIFTFSIFCAYFKYKRLIY